MSAAGAIVQNFDVEDGGDSAAFLAGSARSDDDASAHDASPVARQDDGSFSASSNATARWRLVAAWSCFCWGNRMSNFVIPLLLVDAFPNDLAPAAAYVIISDIAVLLFNPYIGRTIDAGERCATLKRAIVVDFFAIVACITSLYAIAPSPSALL